MNDKGSKEPKGFPKLLSPIRQDESLLHLNDSIHNSSLISLIPCRDDSIYGRNDHSFNNQNDDDKNNDAHTPGYNVDFHHPNYYDNAGPHGREGIKEG